MTNIVIAADLGGTNFRMAAVGDDGKILCRTKKKTPRGKDGDSISDAFVSAAKECIRKLGDGFNVQAISCAVPATVDVDTGVILRAPNLPELDDCHMSSILEERMGISAVLENDANAAALGENWLGASKGIPNSIMVTLGTGVGGGLIIDGKILRGIDGTAGEIGHICVEPNGIECGCTSHGCIEQYASATAVVRMVKILGKRSGADHIAKNRELTSKDVFDLAQAGDNIALEVFKRQGYYLGIMLGGLVNSLNPEVIVIGGGASAAWDLFIGALRDQIAIRAYRRPAERAKLVPAELGDDAGILGAAYLGFETT